MRVKNSKQTAICFHTIAILLSFSCFAASVHAEPGAPARLNQLEKSISGSSSPGSIEQRIKKLEIKVFSKVQAGSLNSRIGALEKFAGINPSSSDFMPPIPPSFDNGMAPVKTAPDRLGGNNAQSAGVPKIRTPELEHQLEEAVKLHQEGKDGEAEQSLRRILDKNPGNADAYFSLGAMAESRGDLQSALEFYTTAMQSNPDDKEACAAVTDLRRKVMAQNTGPFVNPMSAISSSGAPILQGRASELDARSTAASNNYPGRSAITTPPIPNLNISPRTAPNSSVGPAIARSLARAALGAALRGSGLHCPACQLLRGF
jgi:TolA-binding protein